MLLSLQPSITSSSTAASISWQMAIVSPLTRTNCRTTTFIMARVRNRTMFPVNTSMFRIIRNWISLSGAERAFSSTVSGHCKVTDFHYPSKNWKMALKATRRVVVRENRINRFTYDVINQFRHVLVPSIHETSFPGSWRNKVVKWRSAEAPHWSK